MRSTAPAEAAPSTDQQRDRNHDGGGFERPDPALGVNQHGECRGTADQQQPLLQPTLAKLALDPMPDNLLLDQYQDKTDPSKEDDHTAGRLFAGQE